MAAGANPVQVSLKNSCVWRLSPLRALTSTVLWQLSRAVCVPCVTRVVPAYFGPGCWCGVVTITAYTRSIVHRLQLTRGIEKTVAGLVTKLREMGTEVTDEALADVATVSAGNNRVVRRTLLSLTL